MRNTIARDCISKLLPEGRVPELKRFDTFVKAKGSALQLPNFMATAAGIKPAMDDWIPVDRIEQFLEMAKEFGLHVLQDVYFEPVENAENLQGVIGSQLLNTTKARGSRLRPESTSASMHVFLSKEPEQVEKAYESGWYPLIIGNRVMNLPLCDNIAFGHALGYPDCCIEFFRKNDDWEKQNIYYATLGNTDTKPLALCNCLPKSTPFHYTFHIPCSYDCKATIRYASQLRSFIADEEPEYSDFIDAVIEQPILAIAEDSYYLLLGQMEGEDACEYSNVFFIGHQAAADRHGHILRQGNRIRTMENLVLVYRGHELIHVIETRADKFTPEIPFLLSWHESPHITR